MRVPGRERRVQPDLGQQGPGLFRGRLAPGHPVRDQRLCDGRADPHPRVQDPVGVLEHDLCGAPVVLQRSPAQPRDVFSVKTDDPARRPHQAQRRPAYGRLPGAALPDQPEATGPGRQLQAHPVHGADRAEPDGQLADVQQRGPVLRAGRGGYRRLAAPRGHGPASALITGTAASRSAV